jgi:hypothetical protein
MTRLRRAITKGFKDFKWVMRDPDLVNARKDPRFRKVWAKIISVQPER